MKFPITITPVSFSVDFAGLAPREVTTVRHAAQSFSYLLRWKPTWSNPHDVSFEQFADEISRSHDLSNPQIEHTVSTLRAVHQRQVAQSN